MCLFSLVFLVVAETIVGSLLSCGAGIVQCLCNLLCSSRRFVVFTVPSDVFVVKCILVVRCNYFCFGLKKSSNTVILFVFPGSNNRIEASSYMEQSKPNNLPNSLNRYNEHVNRSNKFLDSPASCK